MRKLLFLLAVAAAVVVVVLLRRHPAAPDPAAPMRTDQMIAALKDSGFVVLQAETHGNLLWRLADLERDTSGLHVRIRGLSHELELAGAQVRSYTEVEANAHSTLDLPAERHQDTTAHAAQPDSATTTFDDGVFSGRLAYFPLRDAFRLDVAARFEAAIAFAQGADGRVLATAVPSDSRVQLTLRNAMYQPPPAPARCTIGQRLETGLIAVGAWEGGKLAVRAVFHAP